MRPERWKRNSIFEAVVAGGLDPNECTFEYDDTGSRVTHVPSQSSLVIEGAPGHYSMTAVVGEGVSWPIPESSGWEAVVQRVERWAAQVKKDVDTPDLWAELQRERETLMGARYADVENTPFTPDEQAEIAKQLQEIREYVKNTYSLSIEQMSLVEARFDELEAAARRSGRRDWLLMFLGVLFGLVATGVLPPEAVQHILGMALHGLDHLLGGGGMPPQVPPPPQLRA